MEQYEYKVIPNPVPLAMNEKKYVELAQQMEEMMNQLGIDGWELVQWENSLLIFKRKHP